MSANPTQVFTRDALCQALLVKLPNIAFLPTAGDVAHVITYNGLNEVLAGRHDGKPVTFARGFELVFGERLKL